MLVLKATACLVFPFQAKGINDREEQEAVAASRAPQYRRFGTAAMLLSLVPVRAMQFLYPHNFCFY